jgi:ABC-type phosphate transport system substrate-binding protein
MKTRILALMMAVTVCAIPQTSFTVVVNKDNPANSISKTQLRKMLLGETPSWPGGAKAMVLLGPAGDAARGAALKEVCGMSESDYSKQALQASFAGSARAVKTLPSAAAVRQVVALTAGGLGIIEAGQSGPGLKVLPIE